MSTAGMMHWYEGLFLLPHHLQGLQREVYERSRSDRSLVRAFPYGVVDMHLATEALGEYKLQFDRLHVIMPSGVEVRIGPGGNCDLGVREFRQKFGSMSGGMTVSLGVPLWQSGRANTVGMAADAGVGDSSVGAVAPDPSRVDCLYAVGQASIPDENTGKNEKGVLIRKINARLVLPDESTDNLETLPLARLEAAGTDEGVKPREDPTFLPPCFGIGGSTSLKNLLRDLVSAVLTHRQEMCLKLAGPGVGFSPANLNSAQMMRMFRLRTLNRFGGMLQQLVAAPGVAPFDVYLRLRELLGELAALAPDRDPFDALGYDHDKPGPVFRELDRRIRPLLRESTAGTFKEFKFSVEGRSLVSETVEPVDFANGTDFLLGIQSRSDPNDLTRLVTDPIRFKLAPRRFLQLGEAQINVPGIKLERDYGVPSELPQPKGLNYFRLIPSADERMWRWAQEDRRLCVIWGQTDRFEYDKVSLFVTMQQAQPGAAAAAPAPAQAVPTAQPAPEPVRRPDPRP